jgi:hypothetical protein
VKTKGPQLFVQVSYRSLYRFRTRSRASGISIIEPHYKSVDLSPEYRRDSLTDASAF